MNPVMNHCLPMDNANLVTRSIKTSLFVAAILFVFLSQRVSLPVLWGGALGVMLSALNLYLLLRLSGMFYKKRGLLYAALKLPLFYGLLIFLLFKFPLSVTAFMVGFSVPLFVIILKTLGGGLIFVERANVIRST